MGTRATTTVYEDFEKMIPLIKIYRQMDGNPDAHGEDLIEFIQGKKLVNGIGVQDDREAIWNGMGCLAASLVKYLKQDVGNIYIVSMDHGEEEYNYEIYPDKDSGRVLVRCLEDKEYAQDFESQLRLAHGKEK